MPEKEPTRKVVPETATTLVNLSGFTLSAGNGVCSIGFTKGYMPSNDLIRVIQQKIKGDGLDVKFKADRQEKLLILVVGTAMQAMDLLISFIVNTIRDSWNNKAAA